MWDGKRGPRGPTVVGREAHVSPHHSVSGGQTKKIKHPEVLSEAKFIPQLTFTFWWWLPLRPFWGRRQDGRCFVRLPFHAPTILLFVFLAFFYIYVCYVDLCGPLWVYVFPIFLWTKLYRGATTPSLMVLLFAWPHKSHCFVANPFVVIYAFFGVIFFSSKILPV